MFRLLPSDLANLQRAIYYYGLLGNSHVDIPKLNHRLHCYTPDPLPIENLLMSPRLPKRDQQ